MWRHVPAVAHSSWRWTMVHVITWHALSVRLSSAGSACRKSPTFTTSGMTHRTYLLITSPLVEQQSIVMTVSVSLSVWLSSAGCACRNLRHSLPQARVCLNLLTYYSSPSRRAEYCNERVCLSLLPSSVWCACRKFTTSGSVDETHLLTYWFVFLLCRRWYMPLKLPTRYINFNWKQILDLGNDFNDWLMILLSKITVLNFHSSVH